MPHALTPLPGPHGPLCLVMLRGDAEFIKKSIANAMLDSLVASSFKLM